MLRKAIKMLLLVCILGVLIFIGFMAFIMITDYKPKPVVDLEVQNNQSVALKKNEPFTVLTFNIGYCGLDKGQDFFMDGGKMSRSSSKKQTEVNLENISKFIADEKANFTLIQEIDVNSSRSNHIDELEHMRNLMKEYGSVFGTNYKVPWVPVPVFSPMGSANSGIVTFSQYKIKSGTRYQYPGEESWPTQLFELDRCFVETRVPVENGKELVLINSHLSAFDKGGKIRKQQLGFLKKYIEKEYTEGNYVIVGGDWNHVLPGTDTKYFKTTESWPDWLQNLPVDYKPVGFSWVADKNIPSIRTNDIPYKEGVNFLAVIDGFLVSQNVEVKKVYAHQLNFENSDHNPVTAEFVLR